MDILHWTDVPIIVSIAAAVLLPELLQGFGARTARIKLALLFLCCVGAALLAHSLQGSDLGGAFTRAFLIAITARLSLLLNHIAQAIVVTVRRLELHTADLEKQLTQRADVAVNQKMPTAIRLPKTKVSKAINPLQGKESEQEK